MIRVGKLTRRHVVLIFLKVSDRGCDYPKVHYDVVKLEVANFIGYQFLSV